MAPLTPTWAQPSHGEIQKIVMTNPTTFTTKSLSKISLPPYGLFAKINFPPATRALVPTYATVQMGRDTHLNLNSDLVYINHSCEPSLILDIPSLSWLAGPKGLSPGDELTFFYPSTEWAMAQPFDCFCGTASCRGRIDGAGNMTAKQLEGVWLNGYIREMLAEKQSHSHANGHSNGNGNWNGIGAEVEDQNYVGRREVSGKGRVAQPRGVTSRELSGEMGGDTEIVA